MVSSHSSSSVNLWNVVFSSLWNKLNLQHWFGLQDQLVWELVCVVDEYTDFGCPWEVSQCLHSECLVVSLLWKVYWWVYEQPWGMARVGKSISSTGQVFTDPDIALGNETLCFWCQWGCNNRWLKHYVLLLNVSEYVCGCCCCSSCSSFFSFYFLCS